MEKAEILESTVDYLRKVRKINTTHQKVKETVQARFQQGFSRCAEEILTYIQSVPGVSDNVQHQLRKHLSGRISHIQQVPVTSSTQYVTSYPKHSQAGLYSSTPDRTYERIPSTHAPLYVSVCTSPVQTDSDGLSDSGVECSPDSVKQSSSKLRQHQSHCLSDSELFRQHTRLPVNHVDKSRVSAWVESTLFYSRPIKVEQQTPWRPW